jgi:hypothetical protein
VTLGIGKNFINRTQIYHDKDAVNGLSRFRLSPYQNTFCKTKKIDKINFIPIKKCMLLKVTVEKMNYQAICWKKIFTSHVSDRLPELRINKFLSLGNRRQPNKMGKYVVTLQIYMSDHRENEKVLSIIKSLGKRKLKL